MAFICTVKDENCSVELLRRSDKFSASSHVGYDSFEDVNYWLMVGLSLSPGWGMEFYWRIMKSYGCDDSEEAIWDARVIAEFVCPEDRAKIRALLLGISRHIVTLVSPELFGMATRDAYLPKKALEKYAQLCHVFVACGYTVFGIDPYHGRHAWRMERNSTVAIDSP